MQETLKLLAKWRTEQAGSLPIQHGEFLKIRASVCAQIEC